MEQAEASAAGLKLIAAGLSTFGMIGAGIGVGMIFAAYFQGIARNPAAEPKLQKFLLVGAGFAEALGIFSLLIGLIILFVA
jgi:F-type H+-transporting ATPase subunit c